MGLDMYLEVRKFVSKMDYSDRDNPKPTPEFQSFVDASGIDGLTKYSDFAGIEVSYPVGYWRKANAIHGWFVKNVQDGVDDCRPYFVPREKLMELRNLCAATIKEPAMAGDILPPTQGFFFGTYEIDEWYIRDMEYTVEMIDHLFSILPENDWDYPIYYHSSW
jgi:hypothetical protein